MKVENKVMPNEKQMEEFLEEGPLLKTLPFVFHLASVCFLLSFFELL